MNSEQFDMEISNELLRYWSDVINDLDKEKKLNSGKILMKYICI